MSENHYKVLGLKSSATEAEIKRAYRILARRYHPDVNPDANSQERFKAISEAYKVLSDSKLRADFDFQLSQAHFQAKNSRFYDYMREADQERRKVKERQEEYRKTRKKPANDTMNRLRAEAQKHKERFEELPKKNSLLSKLKLKFRKLLESEIRIPFVSHKTSLTKVSVIEVSVSALESVYGVKKVVEISEENSSRKVSVNIPPGVRSGSVVRMRNKSNSGEEIVLITRLSQHPYLSVDQRGLIVDLPVSVQEAICGAQVSAPSLEEPILLKIPPGSQSGLILRQHERGIKHRDGARGDLLYRIMVQVPEASGAVGFEDKAKELEEYYSRAPRSNYPADIKGFSDD